MGTVIMVSSDVSEGAQEVSKADDRVEPDDFKPTDPNYSPTSESNFKGFETTIVYRGVKLEVTGAEKKVIDDLNERREEAIQTKLQKWGRRWNSLKEDKKELEFKLKRIPAEDARYNAKVRKWTSMLNQIERRLTSFD
jgi:hypothetical protein